VLAGSLCDVNCALCHRSLCAMPAKQNGGCALAATFEANCLSAATNSNAHISAERASAFLTHSTCVAKMSKITPRGSEFLLYPLKKISDK
jgi:hypothetical protein